MSKTYRFYKFKNTVTGEEFERLCDIENPTLGLDPEVEAVGEVPNLFGGFGYSTRIADPTLSTKRAQHFQDNVIAGKKRYHKALK